MKGEGAIKTDAGSDILQMAEKKRHIYLLERMHKGKTLTKKELQELREFESKGKKPTEVKQSNPNIVSSPQKLAKALQCTTRTVRNWIGEGMPVRADKTFDIEAVRSWRNDRDNRRKTPTEEEKINIEIKKQQLQKLKDESSARTGELISRAEVDKKNAAKVLAVKQQLLAMPRALAKALEHLEARQIEAILKDKINDAIRKFSGQ